MNNPKLVLIIAGILIAGLAFSASAQTRQAGKTASARAYYGKPAGKPSFVSNKKYKRDRSRVTKAPKMKARVQAKDGYVRRRAS